MMAAIKGTRGKELPGFGKKGNYLPPSMKPKLLRATHLRKHPEGEVVSIKQVSNMGSLDVDEELDKGLIKREKHSIALKGARVAERDALFHKIATMDIRIPVLERDALLIAAIGSYNRDHSVCPSGRMAAHASLSSSEAFLQRLQVNYLRHRFADYDYTLDQIAGHAGAHRARSLLRRRIHEAISEAYPHLELECCRQDGLGKKQLGKISQQIQN